jgi:murein DD-endopeptidase MepM/ murein hydrolase activator NlpD
VVATPAELAALDAALAIPVSGVQARDLVDSFADARGSRVHQAIDIPAPRGTPVVSATDGRIVKVFDSEAGGLMVYATDPTERFVLLYGHLDRYADGIRDGLPLKRGQLLGYVGFTGNASPETPHLHFAIARTADARQWWGGSPVNPYPLLVR